MTARDYVKGVRATVVALALGMTLSATTLLAQSDGSTNNTGGTGSGTGSTLGTTADDRDDDDGFDLGWLGLLGLAGLAGLKKNDRVVHDTTTRPRT